ncbi:MAG: protein kinase [bacterium]|nr:MAG: protein kinase [bacterium]
MQEKMIGKTVSHYKILEKLGGGGMGVVYKAQDFNLDRSVAIKLLKPHLADNEKARQRFIREAKTASSLDHVNIGTIYEIDRTEDGRTFIAMAYYEGETLRDRMDRGDIDITSAVDITLQLATGLAKAHELQIVHRDIKPENIMITRDGVVKILDFGLAKLTEQTKLTKTDQSVGTPAYMSPEQIKGEDVDIRSDIFSVGVVLYELLTGLRPFSAEHDAALLYEIVHETPNPVTDHRPDIPQEITLIIDKALEKDPGNRYQSTDDLLGDLKLLHKSLIKTTAVPTAYKTHFPLWKRLTKPSVIWPTVFLIVALIVVFQIFYPRSSVPFSKRDWILITSFRNLTRDELFDRSLDMALRISIQQSQFVNVFPRSRIKEILKQMGKAHADTLDEDLGSEVALRGNVQVLVVPEISAVGSEYLLSATFVDPQTRFNIQTVMVRAEKKDDVLNGLSDLAEKIRKGLGESLPSIARRNVMLPQATTSSLEALKKFSDGAWAWDFGKYEEAITHWNEAVRLDSSFAWAHASLGMYYYWHNKRPQGDFHFDRALRVLDQTTERERLWIRSLIEASKGNRKEALKYTRLFLSKYPDNRDAWFNLGVDYMRLQQYENSIEAFNKVIELDPGMDGAYINIATIHQLTGNYGQAIENYETAYRIRPEGVKHLTINNEYGFLYVKVGDYKKAREIFTKMLSESEQKKGNGYRSLALLDMYLGKYSSAIEHLKKAIVFSRLTTFPSAVANNILYLATAYRVRGMTKEVALQFDEFEKLHKEQYLPPHDLAIAASIYLQESRIDDAERLFQDLTERMVENNLWDRVNFHVLKAEIEAAKHHYDEAIKQFEMAAVLRKNGYILEFLAYCHQRNGNTDQAIALYTECIERLDIGWQAQESHIRAHVRLAKLYEEKGDNANAVRYYRKLLDLWKDGDKDLPLIIEMKERLSELEKGA